VTDVRALIASARRLTDLYRDEEATALLDQAAQLLTGSGEARAGAPEVEAVRELALLLERTNRVGALRKLLGAAETIGIGREQIGLPAAAIALQDGRADEAKRLLLHDSPDQFPVRWHRLMIQIADGLGDADAAFAAAIAMKRRIKDYGMWRHRAAAHLQWVRSLAATIKPDWASRLPVLDTSGRGAPAFLVGFPRSGTTLLDTFLMGHPDISVVEEKGMIGAAQATLGDITALTERTPAELEQARNAYFAELDRHVEPGFPGLVLDKLPLNMIAAPLIHCLFPDARFIFARRHPCDAVLSCFMQGFALNDSMACFLDLADAAAYYDAAIAVWTRSREVLALKAHTVGYEDLIGEPEATLRPTIEFLGLGWDEELLEHQETARSRGAISTPSYNQVTQPLSRRASGRWLRYEKQLAPVLPVLLPWAKRLGYED
jgi:hypothetical protein